MEWMLVGHTLSQSALGLGRAPILMGLTILRTTTELARQLGMSPGTTSEHLSRLRRAGLVEPYRSGRSASGGGELPCSGSDPGLLITMSR